MPPEYKETQAYLEQRGWKQAEPGIYTRDTGAKERAFEFYLPRTSRRGADETVPARRWHQLCAIIRPDAHPHAIALETLGEYAAMQLDCGPEGAADAFPSVAAHLATQCTACNELLAECLEMLAREETLVRST